MKKVFSLFLSCLCLLVLTACGSSTSASDDSGIDEDVQAGIVTAVHSAVRENEHFANVKWPSKFDDYNITETGDDTYNTSGEFEHNGTVYNFDIDIYTEDGDSGEVQSYSVN